MLYLKNTEEEVQRDNVKTTLREDYHHKQTPLKTVEEICPPKNYKKQVKTLVAGRNKEVVWRKAVD